MGQTDLTPAELLKLVEEALDEAARRLGDGCSCLAPGHQCANCEERERTEAALEALRGMEVEEVRATSLPAGDVDTIYVLTLRNGGDDD